MKPRMPSIIRSILFSSLLILVPYALVPHAGTLVGYLDNAAEAQACPIKSVTITPSSRTIEAGGSTTFQVTVYLQENSFLDFTGPIILSAINLPSGASSTTH